jgi:hypothetical protein
MDMELSKKTTILFSPELHQRLSEVAARRGMSLGGLVRTACEKVYARPSREERLAAVRKLTAMRLPVAHPRRMKQQAVPRPEEIAR